MIIGVINDEEIVMIIAVDINRRHIFAARAFSTQWSIVMISFRFSREKGESTIEPVNNHRGVIVSVAHIAKFMLLL